LRTQSTQKSILRAVLLLALASLLLAGCAAAGANTWPQMSDVDGNIYLAQNQIKKVDGTNGTEMWVYPDKLDPKHLYFAAPVLANGWVIAGDYGNVVVALDQATRNPVWTFASYTEKGRFIASPVVTQEKVLIPSTDKHLYALDLQTGKEMWKFLARDTLWGAVAVDDKAAYLAGMDHYLYAVDLNTGTLLWELDMKAPMVHGPVFDNGILYLTTFNQEVLALDTASQKVLWQVPVTGKVWNPPLLHDGVLYFGTDLNMIYALSAANGQTVWSQVADEATTTNTVIASPVMLGEDIAFTTESGNVFTVSVEGTRGWTRTIKGKLYTNPLVVNDLLVVSGLEMEYNLVTFDVQGKQDWTYVPPKN
jgi:outer membrane protein assembly factor BamB